MGSKTHYRKTAYSYKNNSYMFNIYTRANSSEIIETQICLNSNNIIFIQSGTAEIKVGDRIKFIRAGDIVIAKRSINVVWSASKDYKSLSILFNTPHSSSLFGEAVTGLMNEFEDCCTVLRLSDQKFKSILRKVEDFLKRSDTKKKTLYVHLWIDLLYNLNEEIEEGLYYLDSDQSHQNLINVVTLVEQFIYKNYKNKITTHDLARKFNVNRTYLCSVFKTVTGFTINQYLNYIRIKSAKDELLKEEQSIIEISHLVGYHSISQFNRQFKLISGLTPTEYRMMWK